eukprot:925245-Pelagomonas_calceolata.AAC.7
METYSLCAAALVNKAAPILSGRTLQESSCASCTRILLATRILLSNALALAEELLCLLYKLIRPHFAPHLAASGTLARVHTVVLQVHRKCCRNPALSLFLFSVVL